MAIDFTHPQISDNYSTGYTAGIVANQIAQAQWLDSVQTTITAGAVQYMKRYNRTSLLFEEYNGSAWATLATNYAVLNANNTFSSAGIPLTINSTNSAASKIIFQDAGVQHSSIGANGTYSFFAQNSSASINTILIDQAGNAIFNGSCSATTFSGASLTLTNGIYFYDSGSGSASIRGGNGSGGYNYLTLTNSGILQVNGSQILTVGAGNAVSATTASTANSLNASNAYSMAGLTTSGLVATASGIQFKDTGTNASVIQLFYSTSTLGGYIGASASYSFSVINAAGSSRTFYADQSGNCVASASLSAPTVTQTSDETKKQNWETPDSRATVRALSKMKTWGNFDFIESGIKSLGVGAQSIRKIPAFKNAIHGDKKTGLTMNYGGAAMVASIALSKELEALRARVSALEAA